MLRIPVSYEERLLNDCHQIYTDTDEGLIAIAQSVGMTLLPPKKKITVMLIGNHSSGKSSFINWYVEEQILPNTLGFTFVTSGRKRASLTSKETFRLYPHVKPIQKVKGVSKYIGTEICTSRQKHFSLVTFVDTPGLVDGVMKYPFDVDQAILQLGEVCDLILVFFDPMGQTLCKHTINIVEKLNERQGDRLHFCLSKADEAGGESHRQWVNIQIMQELRKWPRLSSGGFYVPTIYIPNPKKPSQCVNQIEQVCHTIEKTIKQTVQNTQNNLDKDCKLICETIADTLNDDRQCCQEKWKTRSMSCVLGLMGFGVLLLFMLMLAFIYGEVMEQAMGVYGIEILLLYLGPVMVAFNSVPVQAQLIACGFLMQLSIILHILAFILFISKPILSEKQKRQLQENLESVQQVVKTKKEIPSSGFGVPPPPPPPPPPSPLPPPIPLPQGGRPLSLLRLPAPEVRSRKPDLMFQIQLKHQTLTPIPVEGTVLEELDNECLLQGTANSKIPQRDLMTELRKKDTAPQKIDWMTELKLRKRQASDGAIHDISKQVEQENELRKNQEMAAKEQTTLQKRDLIPELKKKDTTPQKEIPSSGFGVPPPPPPPPPPSPLPPPIPLPQGGRPLSLLRLPAPEVRSRKPDLMFQIQLKHQTLTPIPVEGTVLEELDNECLLQGTANSKIPQRDLMTELRKKDTAPQKIDWMTELKLRKRQASDGAIHDISKQVEQENELRKNQEMAAKEQTTLQKRDLIPELKKKDTTPQKEIPSSGFGVPPPPPPPPPPSPLPPPIPLPQGGRPLSLLRLPAPEVRSRKPDLMFQIQLKHQTLTPIPVEGTVLEELDNECLLQGTANSKIPQRDLMTELRKKDTAPQKIDWMTELKLKRKLWKRQASDGAIHDISKQVEQENELRKNQEMAAKEQTTLQKRDLIPELKKKDTTPQKEIPSSGFGVPPPPPPPPPSPLPPPIPLPQGGRPLSLLRLPAPEVRSRKPDLMFQIQLKHQTLTPIPVEGTVLEELDNECLLQGTANSKIPQRDLMTELRKKDTAPQKIDRMTELKLKRKRQASDGAIHDISKQVEQENELRKNQEMVAKEQTTLQKRDLIPELKKKDTTPQKETPSSGFGVPPPPPPPPPPPLPPPIPLPQGGRPLSLLRLPAPEVRSRKPDLMFQIQLKHQTLTPIPVEGTVLEELDNESLLQGTANSKIPQRDLMTELRKKDTAPQKIDWMTELKLRKRQASDGAIHDISKQVEQENELRKNQEMAAKEQTTLQKRDLIPELKKKDTTPQKETPSSGFGVPPPPPSPLPPPIPLPQGGRPLSLLRLPAPEVRSRKPDLMFQKQLKHQTLTPIPVEGTVLEELDNECLLQGTANSKIPQRDLMTELRKKDTAPQKIDWMTELKLRKRQASDGAIHDISKQVEQENELRKNQEMAAKEQTTLQKRDLIPELKKKDTTPQKETPSSGFGVPPPPPSPLPPPIPLPQGGRPLSLLRLPAPEVRSRKPDLMFQKQLKHQTLTPIPVEGTVLEELDNECLLQGTANSKIPQRDLMTELRKKDTAPQKIDWMTELKLRKRQASDGAIHDISKQVEQENELRKNQEMAAKEQTTLQKRDLIPELKKKDTTPQKETPSSGFGVPPPPPSPLPPPIPLPQGGRPLSLLRLPAPEVRSRKPDLMFQKQLKHQTLTPIPVEGTVLEELDNECLLQGTANSKIPQRDLMTELRKKDTAPQKIDWMTELKLRKRQASDGAIHDISKQVEQENELRKNQEMAAKEQTTLQKRDLIPELKKKDTTPQKETPSSGFGVPPPPPPPPPSPLPPPIPLPQGGRPLSLLRLPAPEVRSRKPDLMFQIQLKHQTLTPIPVEGTVLEELDNECLLQGTANSKIPQRDLMTELRKKDTAPQKIDWMTELKLKRKLRKRQASDGAIHDISKQVEQENELRKNQEMAAKEQTTLQKRALIPELKKKDTTPQKETPSSGFGVPPPPRPPPPSPLPPSIPLPQGGRPLSLLRLPAPEVRSRKPDLMFQIQLKHQTLTPIPVEGTVLEELDNECLLQGTANSKIPQRDLMTELRKKDTAPQKIDWMTELKLKRKLRKRQASDGAIHDISKQVEQENELRKNQEMAAKEQTTLQKRALIPELKKKDTTPQKETPSSGFGVPPPPRPPPPSPLPPSIPLPQGGRPLSLLRLPAPEVRSRKPDLMFQIQLKHQTLTPIPVEGTVLEELDNECLLQCTANSKIPQRDLMTELRKKDTAPQKIDWMTELKRKLRKRQASDGAIHDISKQVEQENELRKNQEMAAKEQTTLQKRDLIPELKKKDTTPQKMDLIDELKRRQLRRQPTQ